MINIRWCFDMLSPWWETKRRRSVIPAPELYDRGDGRASPDTFRRTTELLWSHRVFELLPTGTKASTNVAIHRQNTTL